MEVKQIDIEGPLVIKPDVFGDHRGYFLESFNAEVYNQMGLNASFCQDNQSMSSKGTLRGLHFQAPPFSQGKLVRVAQGKVLDVIVDIRKSSPTFGKHFIIELDSIDHTMLWVPPGFAHGFLTLEDNTIFCYKCTAYYNKASEGSLRWDDNDLNINWGTKDVIISEKDKNAPLFSQFNSPFK